MRLYVIRHANPASAWGAQDSADPGLDDLGRTQAEAACAALLALAKPPQRIVASPMRRCRETAAPFAHALGAEIATEPRVSEIPAPAGLLAHERRAWLHSAFEQTWDAVAGDINYAAWRNDVAAAIAAQPDTAIFSHFVAINAAVSAATDDPRVRIFEPAHASITVFKTDGLRLTLVERGREASSVITL